MDHLKRREGYKKAAMNKAATKEHFLLVKYLHKPKRGLLLVCDGRSSCERTLNGGGADPSKHGRGLDKAAMDGVACANHLMVVKWLHASQKNLISH